MQSDFDEDTTGIFGLYFDYCDKNHNGILNDAV